MHEHATRSGRPPALLVLAAPVAAAALPVAAAMLRRETVARRRWRSVTIAQAGFDPATSPALGPLLGSVRFRTVDAGERGVELHARARRAGMSPARIRAALREAKQLAETGEVLRVSPRPHGRRRRTVLGTLQDAVERRSQGMGVL